MPALVFDYHETPLAVENNGRVIEVPYEGGSTLTIGGEVYELLQFHFHSPSEHAFEGGGRFPLELHAVHRNAQGELAVVGIMIRRGAENPGFPTGRFLRQALPRVEGVEFEFPQETLNLADLLPPAGARAYRYSGSLTTPPCSEGVRWHVYGHRHHLLHRTGRGPCRPPSGKSASAARRSVTAGRCSR